MEVLLKPKRASDTACIHRVVFALIFYCKIFDIIILKSKFCSKVSKKHIICATGPKFNVEIENEKLRCSRYESKNCCTDVLLLLICNFMLSWEVMDVKQWYHLGRRQKVFCWKEAHSRTRCFDKRSAWVFRIKKL